MNFINTSYADLEKTANDLMNGYVNASPFPNISIKNFFNEAFLNEVLSEFPDLAQLDSIQFNDEKQKKFAGKGEKSFGEKTKQFMHYLNSEPFLNFLQKLTGIEEKLYGDPYYGGGGLHEIKKGGLLKVHADFNKDPNNGLDRRLNVLVYLNKDWKEEYGGHFELWNKEMTACEKKILPEFNTLAIFSTTTFSYHGHPDPLTCPDDRSRKSLALYYFSNGRPQEEIDEQNKTHNTLFVERKNNEADIKAFQQKYNPKEVSLKNTIKKYIPNFIKKALR